MTRPKGFSDLKHIIPLVDKCDWDAVNRELDKDHETKQAWIAEQKRLNPKVVAPGFEDEERGPVIDHVLTEATKHDKVQTAARALRNGECNTMTVLEARRYALDHGKRKVLHLLDRHAASWPEPLRNFFNYPGPPGGKLDPRVDERVRADSLHKIRKKRPGRKAPRP